MKHTVKRRFFGPFWEDSMVEFSEYLNNNDVNSFFIRSEEKIKGSAKGLDFEIKFKSNSIDSSYFKVKMNQYEIGTDYCKEVSRVLGLISSFHPPYMQK